jgi:arsenate reductase (thioredoxin)
MSDNLPMVLFVCLRNAGRSQMAAALFNRAASGRAIADSAGIMPALRVGPIVVEAMREVGIDVSTARPKALTAALQEEAALAVTMGCGDACPLVQAPVLEWDLPNPAGLPIEGVRMIRDELADRVEALASDLAWMPSTEA